MPSSRPDRGHRIYEDPRLYDLAFSFRDVSKECDGLQEMASRHGVANVRSVAEIACGPGHHLREFAKRGAAAWGVDLSADMLRYATALCQRDGVAVRYKRADMRAFSLPTRVDLALCLFDSFTHCTTDADGIAALTSVAGALRRGGLMVVEVSHPADYFDLHERRTISKWSSRHPDVAVTARYGVSRRDAVDETYTATLQIDAKYRDGRRPRRIVSRQHHRMWLRSALSNIAARSEKFDVAGWYGDLETCASLSMKLTAWRMIAVLRRR